MELSSHAFYKKEFLIFQKGTCKAWKTKMSYIFSQESFLAFPDDCWLGVQ